MIKHAKKIKFIVKTIPIIMNNINVRWETPDLSNYIADYMNEHPNKKINWFLRKKLTLEFYRSKKKQNKNK